MDINKEYKELAAELESESPPPRPPVPVLKRNRKRKRNDEDYSDSDSDDDYELIPKRRKLNDGNFTAPSSPPTSIDNIQNIVKYMAIS